MFEKLIAAQLCSYFENVYPRCKGNMIQRYSKTTSLGRFPWAVLDLLLYLSFSMLYLMYE